jgi:hypothetical protein
VLGLQPFERRGGFHEGVGLRILVAVTLPRGFGQRRERALRRPFGKLVGVDLHGVVGDRSRVRKLRQRALAAERQRRRAGAHQGGHAQQVAAREATRHEVVERGASPLVLPSVGPGADSFHRHLRGCLVPWIGGRLEERATRTRPAPARRSMLGSRARALVAGLVLSLVVDLGERGTPLALVGGQRHP